MSSKDKSSLDDMDQIKEAIDEIDAETTTDEEAVEDAELSIESLQEQLEAAQKKADENWDTVLRLNADLDNTRKRSEKQVADAHKFAVKKFVEELIPVIDSMEMGLKAEGDLASIREGMRLTQNAFSGVMEKFKIEAIDPLGEVFNPEFHQAMAMNPSDEYEEGQVSAVMQKGYTLSGRLVRPAMVMVVKNA